MLISNHTHMKEQISLCFLYIYKFQCHFTHALFSNQFQNFLLWIGKQTNKARVTTLTACLGPMLENI